MTHKILFNQKTSIIAGKNQEYNDKMVKSVVTYINELFKTKGYVYLETIYGCFGIKWNPLDENLCFIYNGEAVDFKVNEVDDNGLEITFTI